MLALCRAQDLGLDVQLLITFSPPGKVFYAHDKRAIAAQGESLKMPHRMLDICAAAGDFKAAYIKCLGRLRDAATDVLISGDMALVGSMQGNWMRECAEASGLTMYCPLWGADRKVILLECLARRLRVVFTCVKAPWFDAGWIGREITAAVVDELQELSSGSGLDVCGENGEYHTMVLDGPMFAQSLRLHDCQAKVLDTGSTKESKGTVWYLEVGSIQVQDKASTCELVRMRTPLAHTSR
ncbi:hypothetical protein WJX72_004411 [[Myrmecia] bisecta]|uniref:Diphthine--ammonia ligase n=1 Tax=[Myrmecia] bisecta TaxID=41462 RepID=A0AAW1R5X6_9CHLO